MTTPGPSIPPTKNVELSKRSVTILFVVGAILLVAPLGTVLSENASCKSDTSSCGIHSEDYRYLLSASPYIMLGGGVLIGFNMKRISDSINSSELDEEEDEEDEGSFTSYS